jgi:hypothetical protein
MFSKFETNAFRTELGLYTRRTELYELYSTK